MADLEDRFKALVKDVVTPTLKPRGYAKRRLSWVRTGDEALHSIGLQRSHGNAPEHLRFYVELGAYVPEFARTIGQAVPDDPAAATPQYQRRFESVCDWPGQWIDLESWSDAELHPAFEAALVVLDERLARITGPAQLVDALHQSGAGLDLDLFAWWCATGDSAGMAEQFETAHAGFGHEERWPRLYAQFERVAQRFEVPLP
jgi:hypothetical protein